MTTFDPDAGTFAQWNTPIITAEHNQQILSLVCELANNERLTIEDHKHPNGCIWIQTHNDDKDESIAILVHKENIPALIAFLQSMQNG